MKDGNRVSNNSIKKNTDGSSTLRTEGILQGFSVWLLNEGNCKMKSQPGESCSMLKAVNTQLVYRKVGTVEKRVKNS